MTQGNEPTGQSDADLDAELASALSGLRRGDDPPVQREPPLPDSGSSPAGPTARPASGPPTDPADVILEAEFGVYVQAASAPPPVPAFDESKPPWEGSE